MGENEGNGYDITYTAIVYDEIIHICLFVMINYVSMIFIKQ